MTTTKNGKTVINNVRDLKAGIEASKPDVSTLKNRLLEAFAQDYSKMDQIKAHKANLAQFQADFDQKAKTAAQWRRDSFEIEKAIAVAKSDAQLATKEDAELNELHNFLKSQGREEEWKQFIFDDHVVLSVGAEKVSHLAHIKGNSHHLVKEMEDLKVAIENEKKAIADLQK